MDIYRASDIHQSPINRSFVSQSRLRSTLESTIDYQNKQVSLSKIMKYLFLTLFTACLLLVVYSFADGSGVRVEPVDKTGWSFYENFKYSVFDIPPASPGKKDRAEVKSEAEPGLLDSLKEFWFMDKNCGHIKELEERLRSQRHSVQRHMENMPSLDDIKTNRKQYELFNELNQSCLEGEFDLKSPLFSEVVTGFDKLIGTGHLTPESTQDDFSALNAQLQGEEERYKDVARLMDNDFVYGVKTDVNDLVNSHRNLQEKKVLLNGYRFNLFNHMKQLESIVRDIKQAKAESDGEKAKELDLKVRLDQAEALVKKFDIKIKRKEASMGERQKKELAELREMSDRIEEVKASIINADKIRAECRIRRDRIAKTQNQAADIESKIKQLEQEDAKLQAERKDRNNKIKKFNDANEIYDQRKNIHTIKLEVLLRNREIKAFLDKLLNSQTNIDNLSALVNSKISDEEKLILLMNQYNEDAASMESAEGKAMGDTESVTSDVLKSKIEKDREDFRQIMEKYLGLKKVVDEYEDPDLEIKKLKTKIKELEKSKDQNSIEQHKLQKEIDRLDRQINDIDNQLRSMKDKHTSYKTAIEQDENFVKNKEDQLVNSQKQLDDLQDQKRVLDEKYKVG